MKLFLVGETVTLPIRLSGTGPWSLTVNIISFYYFKII